MKLIFATGNQHKLMEVKKIMPSHIELWSLKDINFNEEIEETGKTLEENALLKAKTIFLKTGISCMADDSGLLVDALNGEPGVYSARYAGPEKNDENNTQKLLKELHTSNNRSAHFKTVIALVTSNTEVLFDGIIEGQIISEKRGANGFGYDPVFVPNGYQKTFAELSLDEKSKISHRAKAMQKLLSYLTESTK
jgi:XTP/dITP diphosphohydrolase